MPVKLNPSNRGRGRRPKKQGPAIDISKLNINGDTVILPRAVTYQRGGKNITSQVVPLDVIQANPQRFPFIKGLLPGGVAAKKAKVTLVNPKEYKVDGNGKLVKRRVLRTAAQIVVPKSIKGRKTTSTTEEAEPSATAAKVDPAGLTSKNENTATQTKRKRGPKPKL